MLTVLASSSLSASRVIEPGIAFALLLLAAIIGGYAAHVVRLPRVVGYLVAGLVLRYALTVFMSGSGDSAAGAEVLAHTGHLVQGVKSLALGLILFAMGSVLERKHLKSVGKRIWRLSAAEILCVFAVVSVGCVIGHAITGAGNAGEAVTFGVLLGLAGVATAPAATLLVLREYDAKGPVSDTILTLTALNNTASVVLFYTFFLIFSALGMTGSASVGDRNLWLDLLMISVGSVVLGTLLGFALSVLYSKLPLAEFLMIFLALLLGLGEGGAYLAETLNLSFNFLLTCLFCGAVFANVTIHPEPLHQSLRTLGWPVFAGFFVLAGYELHVGDLGALGLVGVLYVVLRVVGKALGGYVGARWAHAPGQVRGYVGWGMLCQAGVALGLADYLANTWGSFTNAGFEIAPTAAQFKTIVLGSVVLFELLGPLSLKSVIVRSGEVKAITLMRRDRAAVAEGDSVVRTTWGALVRTLGLSRSAGRKTDGALQVKHIMRSNITLLPAAANLDEVLHFVEKSRYNHWPVVDDDGQFLGMISFQGLRDIIYDPYMRTLVTAVDLASPTSPTAPQDLPLTELLELFKKTDLASLAVVSSAGSRRVVGLVEQRDLLRVLHGPSKSTE